MIDGSAAIDPHHLGLLMLRGISSTGLFGHAKQCGINAFGANYLLSAGEVMASIFHLAHNMEEELHGTDFSTYAIPACSISAFVAAAVVPMEAVIVIA
jgi:hypothetical protein